MGCVCYHLGGLKQYRGLDKYQFDQNPDSLYAERIQQFANLALEPLHQFREQNAQARNLPLPETLGIRPIHAR